MSEQVEYLACEECGKSDETVEGRYCSYDSEINGKERYEVVCDRCEHNHGMEI